MKSLFSFIPLITIFLFCNCKKSSSAALITPPPPVVVNPLPIATSSISYNSDKVLYMGRKAFNATLGYANFYWAGTSVELDFKGTEVSASLAGNGKFLAIIDNNDS